MVVKRVAKRARKEKMLEIIFRLWSFRGCEILVSRVHVC